MRSRTRVHAHARARENDEGVHLEAKLDFVTGLRCSFDVAEFSLGVADDAGEKIQVRDDVALS